MTHALLPMPPYTWQQDIWHDFCTRISNDRLPHAFILAGQEGIGGEDLALAMGQYLLCQSPLKNMACGKCRACQLLVADTHPDLLAVRPEVQGKQIKIDQIREISDFVSQTARQGGFKVIIIAPAELMNINASNALLKNLEEPAGKTVFLLVTAQLSRVLPTIRSRCAKIALHQPSFEQSVAWLKSSGLDDPEQLLSEVRYAPLLAKQWHNEGLLEQRFALVRDLTDVSSHVLEPMVFAKKWSGVAPLSVLESMMTCVDHMVTRLLAHKRLPKSYVALYDVVSQCPPQRLFRLRDLLCEKKKQLLDSPNLNSDLLLEELALDWAAII